MYTIKNKATGRYAAKKSWWVFRPCEGKLTPILYGQKRWAENKIDQFEGNRWHSIYRGWMNDGDELEVVEVELIERFEVKALPDDIPADWEQLSLYP